MSAYASQSLTRPRTSLFTLGLLLIVLGVGINWFWWAGGTEFNDFRYTYTLSRMLMRGENAYDYDQRMRTCAEVISEERCQSLVVLAYPPATGVILIPLALLPWPIANVAWFLICMATLLGGLWYLLHAFFPDLPDDRIALAVGIVACSSCVRWGLFVLQAAPMIAGLLGIYLAALLRHHSGLAILCALIGLCLKMTNGLPFIGLAIFQRKRKVLAGFLGLWLLFNLLGMMRMGGATVLGSYRANLAQVADSGVDAPSPYDPMSHVRLDLPYLLNAIHPNIALSQKLSFLLTLAALLMLVHEGWRGRAFAASADVLAAFSAPLSCFALFVSYHHHYEASLLLPPLLLLILGPPQLRPPLARWCFIVPSAVFFGLYPYGRGGAFVLRHFGPTVEAYAKAVGCAILVVGFLGSLAALHRLLDRTRDRTQASVPPTLQQ